MHHLGGSGPVPRLEKFCTMLNKKANSLVVAGNLWHCKQKAHPRRSKLERGALLLVANGSSILPFVQHNLLAAEESLTPHLALVRICGPHEFHDALFDTETGNLLLSLWMERYELADVMASHCQCCVIVMGKQMRECFD